MREPATSNGESTFDRLQAEVIQPGICTHCGTCAGLSHGTVEMVQSVGGPLPAPSGGYSPDVPTLAYDACPGKGVDYPALYRACFDALPENWLVGPHRQFYVGHAADPAIRRQGASGGAITQTLLYLLDAGLIDGAVVLQQGRPRPWLAEPVIARTRPEIVAASQSVYIPSPVNTILPQMAAFEGRLGYVGLPDQVAALRCLQLAGHPGARKVDYVLGPYVGTAIYLAAIESYLRANGVDDLEEVVSLRYREGEWPGYLQIELRSGRMLRAQKFYYNYLIPFYITQASLQAVDFTNELTDISVGDAWHPRYEARGEGYSVVVARTVKGQQLLERMRSEGRLALEPADVDEAMAMHGHMLDFKKRGAFIRNDWRRRLGSRAPSYGYHPAHIPLSRKGVELFISLLFALGRTRLARRLVEIVPLAILGPLFNMLRKTWKNLSKPVKRKGLRQIAFVLDNTAGEDGEQRSDPNAKNEDQ